MPEWLRAIGEATPAITQMQSAVQDMSLQDMKMREAQAEIDILDKPKPLVDRMAKFEGSPETANAFLKIAGPFIKTDPSGVKYLTERVERHIRKQILDDDSMLDMVQKARGRDAENQVFAAHAALQKAREKGKPEDIQAAMENYKKTVEAMSIFSTANIEFDRKRREAMAKRESAKTTIHPNIQVGEENVAFVQSPDGTISPLPGARGPKWNPKEDKPEMTAPKVMKRLTELAVIEKNLNKVSPIDALTAAYLQRPDLTGKTLDEETLQKAKEQIQKEMEYLQGQLDSSMKTVAELLSGQPPGRYRVQGNVVKWNGQKVIP